MNGEKLRHLAVRMGFVIDAVENEDIEVKRIDSAENTADLFTKGLKSVQVFLKHKAITTHERE